MHPGPAPWSLGVLTAENDQGRESEEQTPLKVISMCTEICGGAPKPRSSSKICLVNIYQAGCCNMSHRVYAVLDNQSNQFFSKITIFFYLFCTSSSISPYTLRTYSGIVETAGRKASNIILKSPDGKTKAALPTLLECNNMPNDSSEIPTPEIMQYFPHHRIVVNKIPPLDTRVPIILLLGRDILSLHKVHEQCNGPHNLPYAQRLDLGWVTVGEICLGGAHKSDDVNVYKTLVLQDGCTSFLKPCTNNLHVKERLSTSAQHYLPGSSRSWEIFLNTSLDRQCVSKNT